MRVTSTRTRFLHLRTPTDLFVDSLSLSLSRHVFPFTRAIYTLIQNLLNFAFLSSFISRRTSGSTRRSMIFAVSLHQLMMTPHFAFPIHHCISTQCMTALRLLLNFTMDIFLFYIPVLINPVPRCYSPGLEIPFTFPSFINDMG